MEKVEQKNKSTPGQRHLMEVYASVRDLLPDYGRQTWEPSSAWGGGHIWEMRAKT